MKKPPLYSVYPIKDLRDFLIQVTDRYSSRVALRSKKHGTYTSLTYSQLGERVTELATAFSEFGLRKGDRVAMLSENRTEWAVAYLAAVTAGLVAVPIDRDLTVPEICHVLNFSKPRILVCSRQYVDQIKGCRSGIPSLEQLISMEEENEGADLSYPEALRKGQEALLGGSPSFQEIGLSAKDPAVIIFTSGTTGNSKGVMLTHGNIVSNVMATSQYISIQDGVLLSVLPLHHTYESMGGFLLALYQGCSVCHAESLRRIPENLKETGATVMLGVPLLFETFYRRIESGIKQKGQSKFRLALGIAFICERLFRLNVRRRLFKPIHDQFGGRLQLFISGGAAVNPQVAKGFRELGFDFIQGYGMSEASPIISVNRVNCFKDDSVGLPVPGVEVKIVGEEILVRGPSVMAGYYLNETATRGTLKEGWLHSGDLGYLDPDGFLYINGRRKSVIVTPNGKNVYPEEVEALLDQSRYILESLVWGGPDEDPSQVEVQAIVVPCAETFDQEFGPNQYDEANMREVIAEAIKEQCRNLARYKRVKKFILRKEEFEKTTTRKIKRYLYTAKP
ncbi:MAG: AMP-binding protein [Acidobacteria bacterium]|nr:AMP-binding protein [Acidobacteriota bacterium]